MPVEGIDPINYLNWVLDFFSFLGVDGGEWIYHYLEVQSIILIWHKIELYICLCEVGEFIQVGYWTNSTRVLSFIWLSGSPSKLSVTKPNLDLRVGKPELTVDISSIDRYIRKIWLQTIYFLFPGVPLFLKKLLLHGILSGTAGRTRTLFTRF